MKTRYTFGEWLKITITPVLVVIILFVALDFGLRQPRPLEIGIVTYKTFAPPGDYNSIHRPPHYLIVVYHPGILQGYLVSVSRKDFYDLSINDRLPIRRVCGFLTGYAYSHEVLISEQQLKQN